MCACKVGERASLIAQPMKNHLQCRRLRFHSWVGKIPWRRDRLPTPGFMGFPGGSAGTDSARKAGDLGSIPGRGRSPCGGHSNPLQYPCLENPQGQRSLAGYRPWGRRAPRHPATKHSTAGANYQKQKRDRKQPSCHS